VKAEIAKLHTILEILTPNPISETHFFGLGAFCISKFFYGALYALRNDVTSDRLQTFFREKSRKIENAIDSCSRPKVWQLRKTMNGVCNIYFSTLCLKNFYFYFHLRFFSPL